MTLIDFYVRPCTAGKTQKARSARVRSDHTITWSYDSPATVPPAKLFLTSLANFVRSFRSSSAAAEEGEGEWIGGRTVIQC